MLIALFEVCVVLAFILSGHLRFPWILSGCGSTYYSIVRRAVDAVGGHSYNPAETEGLAGAIGGDES